MKFFTLVVEIKRKDDKWETHLCNDFPTVGSEFLTLYKEGFKRENIRIETVAEFKTYFKSLKKYY